MPRALQKFTEKKIQLYDTSQLFDEVIKTQWLELLKKTKWAGPYNYDNDYSFQTVTDSGDFGGLLLQISLNTKTIELSLLDRLTNICGTHYIF